MYHNRLDRVDMVCITSDFYYFKYYSQEINSILKISDIAFIGDLKNSGT